MQELKDLLFCILCPTINFIGRGARVRGEHQKRKRDIRCAHIPPSPLGFPLELPFPYSYPPWRAGFLSPSSFLTSPSSFLTSPSSLQRQLLNSILCFLCRREDKLCAILLSFQTIWSICSNDFRKFGIIAKKEESSCILCETIVKYKCIGDTTAI